MNESEQISEDELRGRIMEISPQIRADVQVMAGLIREAVNFEREKLGLDDVRGVLELWINKEKKNATDPDWIGTGKVHGRHYLASGWLSKEHRLKLTLKVKKGR